MPGWLSWTPGAEDPSVVLAALGIKHYDEDILSMPIARLRQEFGWVTTEGLQIGLFFRNVIWQLYEEIKAGNPPDFFHKHGFVRGMWYHIKGRIARYKQLRGDHYGTMDTVMTQLVAAGLVTYRDFNFRDRDADMHVLGTENPHVIVFCEKDGFISLMENIARIYGCTTVTLGGTPSLMTNNFMVADMAAAGFAMDATYCCFSIVDFDPAGDNNAEEFIKQLAASGVRNFHMFDQYGDRYPRLDLVKPSNLVGVNINSVKYVLSSDVQRQATTLDWARRTGGVDGKGSHKFGLESDEFTEQRIYELVDEAVTPFLVTPPEVLARRNTMRRLGKTVTDFMVWKILHPPTPPVLTPA